ncbi:hypothetical protein F4777DRAFT_146643 [Nemania sp. FL0916]|nr:hypothetical protein F4777DRAFT_146643 [Nemania sp. FL0916]
MSAIISEDQQRNYELFRDCLATALLEKISEPQKRPRRRTKAKSKRRSNAVLPTEDEVIQDADKFKESTQRQGVFDKPTVSHIEHQETNTADQISTNNDDRDDLAEFTDYIATEIFSCLPPALQTIDHHDFIASPPLQAQYSLPLTAASTGPILATLSPEITDSLTAYGITHEDHQGIAEFLAPVLSAFIAALATPPPPPRGTRPDACEICGRDWINLSYHHLIPRFVHAKAVKRGWHRECDLQNVAWLCGACHRFVHRFADHEGLARRFYTVEKLMREEEVRRWAEWVGRLRWKGRQGEGKG